MTEREALQYMQRAFAMLKHETLRQVTYEGEDPREFANVAIAEDVVISAMYRGVRCREEECKTKKNRYKFAEMWADFKRNNLRIGETTQ